MIKANYDSKTGKREKNDNSFQASDTTSDLYKSIFHSANLFSKNEIKTRLYCLEIWII